MAVDIPVAQPAHHHPPLALKLAVVRDEAVRLLRAVSDEIDLDIVHVMRAGAEHANRPLYCAMIAATPVACITPSAEWTTASSANSAAISSIRRSSMVKQ